MQLRTHLAAVAATGALLAVPAQALTISFSDSLPLEDVEINGTLSVSKFDPALGVLTGVTFEIVGEIASEITIENDGDDDVNVEATTTVEFELDAAELSLDASPDLSISVSTGDVVIEDDEEETFSLAASDTLTGSEAPSADFVGLGVINLDFATSTAFAAAGGGSDISFAQAADAGLTFTSTDYSEAHVVPPAVPVPPSVALMAFGAGVLGAGVLHSRRRRR